jgi:hypothetical protein
VTLLPVYPAHLLTGKAAGPPPVLDPPICGKR